jgi:DNA-binding LacI/PurR family transcriptional regulator
MKTKKNVVDDLLRMIRNETLPGGSKIPPIRQLCIELGTSYVTTAKAVQELTQRGILSSRVGQGTFVNPFDQHPFKSRAFCGEEICYIFTNDENNVYENYQIEIYCELQKVIRGAGFIDRAVIPVDGKVQDLDTRKVAGVVVDSHQPFIDKLLQQNIPVVYCSSVPPRKNLCSAIPDFYQGSSVVTQHLIESGYRDIFYVGPYQSANEASFSERYSAYCDTMHVLGRLPVEKITWHHIYMTEQIKNVLQSHRDSLGLFAANDVIASEILSLADDMNLYDPEKIGIAGLENMRCSQSASISITTAGYSKKILAETAFDLLLSRINGESTQDTVRKVSMEIVPRKSTCSPMIPV